jgi:NADH:ubiquinone oxidoreductase subunit F (NADH-binding)/Pyruvate/2-oxoacid:ferredoxin oxidoreductase delta subunit/(2Fe-2S) ferredoxin
MKTNHKTFLTHLLDKNALALDPQSMKQLQLIRKDYNDEPIIYIGAGTCGLGAGAGATKEAIQQYLEVKGLNAEIIDVGCIGLCSSEPIMDVKLAGKQRISFEKVQAEQVTSILDALFENDLPEHAILGQFPSNTQTEWPKVDSIYEHPFFKPQQRIVLDNCGIIDPVDIDEYLARDGYKAYINVIKNYSPEAVCDMVEASGLRGRGGGGFPTGKKWKFALNTPADQKYFICNADEGDPGAFMDRAIIEGDPFKLIEGLAISAYAIGATKSYIYIRAEYPLAIERLEIAIEKAREYGFIGKNIFGTSVDLEFVIKKGAGAFVCGEETALIHSIEGKRGMPRPRPPYPAISGLFQKPTIINNVETMANIAWIINHGAAAFANMGTQTSKGTKVFALSGKSRLTGLIEVAMGTTIRDIIYHIGGGILGGKTFKAVQMGGPSGGCVTEANLDIEIDYENLLEVDAMMGSGGMVVMDEETCMVDVAKFFMDFIQRESCGKCIPCREGTFRMLEILERITAKPDPRSEEALIRFKGIMELEKLAEVIRDTSLCGLGQSAPNPVLSTLKWFRHEYEEHIYDRKCRAGVCQSLKTFTIDVDACTGCTICAKKCPTNAIIGSKKQAHYVIEDKCIGCGTCDQVCKFDAIRIS